uniref:START domain-containing protein n=1 Tax=Acrobeloides nanus TaxID=290746 RepID=A0A914C4A3_9BILA
MRGYIASREFVDVRRLVHNQENDSYIGAFISLDLAHQSSSSLNGRIRGKNGINIIRITPCADSSESIYEWIMNTDLRGDIPKVIIRRAIGTYLTSYIKMLEAYINENRHKYQ